MEAYSVAVITVSDRAFKGEYPDRSGPLAKSMWSEQGGRVVFDRIVPDDEGLIGDAIKSAVAARAQVVFTTGGTGVGPRDVTAEATSKLVDYELAGIAQAIRQRGQASVPTAIISRGIVGVLTVGGKRAVVINAAGSTGAVKDAIEVVAPLVPHIVDQLVGGDH
ncbi:MAG: MogA/MoaB family molybdenum cofactor biosynthesis protein [Actinomycetaceae bacterium]|nr:MogA/MoaB family molybdenum cofactor biosynthesis protein [Actinomycetaceae bacterium]